MWHPEMKDAPNKTVDRQRAKELSRKQEKEKPKLKNNSISNMFRITKSSKSTSKAAKSYKKRYWKKATIRDFVGRLEEPKPWHQFEKQKIEDRYGDEFHR